MKSLLFTLFFFISYSNQAQEFDSFENGLIYSQPTMTQLAQIVDSLNFQHQTCEQFPHFQSRPQGEALCIVLEIPTNQRATLIKELETSISLAMLQTKYNPEITDNHYIVQQHYYNSLGQKIISFSNINTA